MALVVSANTFAQAPNCLWATSAGGNSSDVGYSSTTDASGNVYVTGGFSSPTIAFGTTTLTNVGSNDIFIAKYDSIGTVLWAKSAGGTSTDYGFSVSTDAIGNVYVTGGFSSPTISFGTTTLTNAGNAGSNDIFIVKYNAAGTMLWAKSAGGTSIDRGQSISTDASGNVYFTGGFQSATITFGTTTLTNAGSAGIYDIFIAKYDAAGTVLWAKSAGGTSDDEGRSVTADASGNVYVTGHFFSPTITYGTTTLNNVGSGDIFIAKYDAAGTVQWAKKAGGTDNDAGISVTSDVGGNVYITGGFQSATITLGTTTLTNANNTGTTGDMFIAKYDASGTVLWSKSAGGTYDDIDNSVTTDASGNVYVTGNFASPTITFGTTTLTNADNTGNIYDMFIAKYDAAGTVLWSSSAGGIYNDYGYSVSTDASSNVFVVGSFRSATITFGSTTLTNAGSAGIYDIFIAKYDGTVIGVRVDEMFGNKEVSVSPNPFASQTTITFNEEQKNTTLYIRDALGKVIRKETFSGKQFVIEKGNITAGIYFVQTTDEKKNLTNNKIIIQ